MRILALQLKRIGDVVLTTPALRALRAAAPEAKIALAVAPDCAELLSAIDSIDAGVVLGKGRGFAPWQQVLTGPWDVCLDFTGTDRSGFASVLSRATDRVTFAWVQRAKVRALAYTEFVDSPVRERHTADHYLDLVRGVFPDAPACGPALKLPTSAGEFAGPVEPFAVIHPGSARTEKYWLPERWAEVIAGLDISCVLTGGSDEFERAHIAHIQHALSRQVSDLSSHLNLLTLTALISRAALVVSCDTAVVHFAAAFERPQVALFGPTNPFHWRPRHSRSVVLSAAHPAAPLREFTPRMKGAPMERISTALVNDAIASLLDVRPAQA